MLRPRDAATTRFTRVSWIALAVFALACGGGEGRPDGAPDGELPGAIEGVEPEAHSHHPPMCDGNGNLYRITEAPESEGNRPKMMKSSDGGGTWAEVDADNRPAANDLEGGWQLQEGTAIYASFTHDATVWFEVFHTSDAADRPDQWVTEEVIDSGLSEHDVEQFSSLARTADGQFWAFYSDTLAEGRQQIGFRRRTGAGTWASKTSVDVTTGSWTSPVGVVDGDDVTHLFYKDHLADQLMWRTLGPGGQLSDATRIDTSGTSAQATPQTNPVAFEDSEGRQVVVIAFATAGGVLTSVTITGGAVGAEQPISAAAVMLSPGITDNGGAVAHLALDGTTVHAMWADAATGDIVHGLRAADGSWTGEATAWDSGDDEAHWLYAAVYQRGGVRRLGFTYDVGPHADDSGQIRYDEIQLDTAR
jgi:hypothetical protein